MKLIGRHLPVELIDDPCPFRVLSVPDFDVILQCHFESIDRGDRSLVERRLGDWSVGRFDSDQQDWMFSRFADLGDAIEAAIDWVMPRPESILAAVTARDLTFAELGGAD